MRKLRIGNKVLAKKTRVETQPSNIDYTQQKYVNPCKGYIRMDDESLEIVPKNIPFDIATLPRYYYTYNYYVPNNLDFRDFVDSLTKGENK